MRSSAITEETTVSDPMTDDDLAAIERLLMYGVIGTDPADASGATTDDVAEVAGDLLAEVKRLQEERSAMLDPARERTNFLEAEVARLRNERKVIAEKWLDEAFENRRLRDQMGDRRE